MIFPIPNSTILRPTRAEIKIEKNKEETHEIRVKEATPHIPSHTSL